VAAEGDTDAQHNVQGGFRDEWEREKEREMVKGEGRKEGNRGNEEERGEKRRVAYLAAHTKRSYV
jgi:hypothetical protein